MQKSRPGKFVLMSLAATAHTVEAFQEVAGALSEDSQVDHAGLSLDEWYGGSASSTYERLGIRSTRIFRPEGSREPWWLDPAIDRQFSSAIPHIRAQVTEQVAAARPDAFVLADDNGPLEILLIRVLQDCGVSVVYVEHAPDLRALVWPSKGQMAWRALRSLPRRLRRRPTGWDRRLDPASLRPRPKRDIYPICAYSGVSVELLRHLGVAEHRIRDTGFPWMDVIARASQPVRSRPLKEGPKKLLCVSSGWAVYGPQHRDRADSFFELVIQMAKALPQGFTLELRPKGDELKLESASGGWAEKLRDGGVGVTSTDEPSYAAIQNYDAVLGDVTSVLIEAIVSHIPTVLLHHADVPDRSNAYKLESLLSERFVLLSISDPRDTQEVLFRSLSPEYLQHQDARLEADQGYSFPRPDGRCARRVADEILRTVSLDASRR